jgi:hypothetical protein
MKQYNVIVKHVDCWTTPIRYELLFLKLTGDLILGKWFNFSKFNYFIYKMGKPTAWDNACKEFDKMLYIRQELKR